jgi:hypothetical protein
MRNPDGQRADQYREVGQRVGFLQTPFTTAHPGIRRKRQRLTSNDPIETAPTARTRHARISASGQSDRDLSFIGTNSGALLRIARHSGVIHFKALPTVPLTFSVSQIGS